jgi:DNA repair protein RecO (recombination protein O)
MSLYRDRAIVLRSYKFGEADRVVVMLTRDSGKVRAVAKGIRKSGSRIGARLEPFGVVEILLWKGRDLDTVRQVDMVTTNNAVRTDLGRLERALAMVEAVEKATPDREAVPEVFTMLERALAALNEHDSPLLAGAFFLKFLALEGSGPCLERCVRCGEEGSLGWFDVAEGGALCGQCRSGVALSAGALALMCEILNGGLAGALARSETGEVHEVNEIARAAMEHHLERRLRSIGVMDRPL